MVKPQVQPDPKLDEVFPASEPDKKWKPKNPPKKADKKPLIKRNYEVRIKGKDKPAAKIIENVHDECEAIAAFCLASQINSYSHEFRVTEVVAA